MYRAGLIGLTGIGARRHSADLTRPLTTLMPGSHAGAYALHPGIELVGVCDIRPEAREQFRADWSDVWPEVHCCSDYRELLGLGLDFLSVCTPDHLHAQMVVDACAHPVKGILCEKPLATTLFDADRMIEASEASGVPMQVDHTRRWRSIYQH
ncbi:MAG: Gfo/Idh/MocA family oxidoreductase, partial [Armatimonadetes bacterium]|nr:Gfo/Idh/MocA family oxidoreductase [Armatimonadota bacterium]